jgi:3-hydroxyisobutyrate dehydrogenase-like beta-hydroxyacid dehydrogenase
VKPAVGFIGLGRMGTPLAQRILAAGFPLVVYDIEPAVCAPLVAAGALAAATPGAAAAGAAVVMSCVPGPAEVEAVLLGSGGVLSAAAPGTIVVEMSTIDVALSRRFDAACAARGCRYLDAPISGGVDGARAGTLAIMAGGDAATLAEVRDLLACIATTVVHLGPAGCGHLAKLINQMIYLGYVALFCEATSAADAAGLDRAELIDVLRHSVAGHPLATHWEERLITRDITPGFAIARVLKDLRLAANSLAELPLDAPVFAAALAAYEAAAQRGHAGDDVTAVRS